MPFKRSRIGRSSSFGEIGVLSPRDDSASRWQGNGKSPPPSKPAKYMRRSAVEESEGSGRTILTVSSPVQDLAEASAREPIEGFLDNCYFCKRKILEDAEVFMYGTLLAFCSPECRDRQMFLDKDMEKHHGKGKAAQLSGTGRRRVSFGFSFF